MKNYYDILEIHPDSGREVVEASYKSLYKHYNPDNFASDEEKLQAKIMRNQLDEAYKVLAHPAKKAKYDKYFKEKSGDVETKRLPHEGIIFLIALAVVIVIMAKYLGDIIFRYFTKFTVLVGNSPILSTILALIIAGIVTHALWKASKKR